MKIRKYRLVHAPIFAFFSKRLYREVGRKWKGVNLAYVFLLLAMCCIPPAMHVRNHMVQSTTNGQLEILNQIPEIRIKNGMAKVDQTKPVYIKRADGKPVAIIDTTGSMNYIDHDTVWLLLTESKLVFRIDDTHFNTVDLDMISDFYVDKEVVNEWFQNTKAAIAPISYGIFLMLSYIFAVLTLLLVAIVGLILSAIMRSSLQFKDTLRIATVAATPAIIFITIAASMGFSAPIYLYLGVTLMYVFIGVKSCSGTPVEEESGINLKAALQTAGSDDFQQEAA
jgi:maltodextrin utilization protein YvdJ